MPKETAPKKEKSFENNRKNQKHLAKNFDKALATARQNESAETAAKIEQYLIMAAQGAETNWKPKPAEVPQVEPTAPSPVDEAPEEATPAA